MEIRKHPYFKLYVQDFLTDEKLMECSASATGIFIRLMCIMHKSENYGKILLKQTDKQTDKQILNFASKLARYLPYSINDIEAGLTELLSYDVIQMEDDCLLQKRMVRDYKLSEIRALAGSEGGKSTQGKKKKQPKNFAKAKIEANSEYEYEIENEIEIKKTNKVNFHFSIDFVKHWNQWKEYKDKEHKFKFRTLLSEQTALDNLQKLSNGNEQTAIAIIDQSIINGWKGLFAIKSEAKSTKHSNGAYQLLEELRQEHTASVRSQAGNLDY